MNVPLTPLRFLRHAARQYRHRTAVVCGDKRFSYEQFADRVSRLAGALRETGVSPGDRVAFLGLNTHRLLEAYYGVIDSGAVLLPLNVRLAAAELTYVLNDSSAKFLFIEAPFLPLVDSFRDQLSSVSRFCVLDGAPNTPWLMNDNYDALLSKARPYQTDVYQIDEDQVAEIFYTSGTSARPKGVMLTHRNVYLHALHVALAFGVENGCAELHTIPLFHANGWGIAHFVTLLGGKHVMLPQFDPKEVFRLVETERVNHFSAVPIMATSLVNCPDRSRYDLSSLRRIVIGGAAASPSLIRDVEQALGCACFSGYGLTETSPALSASRTIPNSGLSATQRHEWQAKAGVAIPGVDLQIIDPENLPLPHDGQHCGELVARGDGVMKGYWNQPEASAEALRDGWFHTGDIATIDEDGCVSIVDRKKDIIISGGENISSLEVEKTILSHPAVLEATVIAISDETWGEVPKALVVLKPGISATEPEIIEFCRSHLSHYKCPRSVDFVDGLPKTGTGKVLKRDLRKQYDPHLRSPDCGPGQQP